MKIYSKSTIKRNLKLQNITYNTIRRKIDA
nr:MAG TPA: hypothetical protein [Caudoviricetes sp.]